MIFTVIISFLCAFIGLAESANGNLQRCSLSDPALEKCLTNAAQISLSYILKGIPEYNIEPFEVVSIDDVHDKLPAISLDLTDNQLYGPGFTKFKSVKIDPIKKKISLKFEEFGYLLSNYKIDGRLIILPIIGEGKSRIDFKKVDFDFEFNYEVVKGKNGKDYWKIIKHNTSLTPLGMKFKFENLFGGNEQLSEAVHRFSEENWEPVYLELGGTVVKKILQKYRKHVIKILSSIPVEDMFLP